METNDNNEVVNVQSMNIHEKVVHITSEMGTIPKNSKVEMGGGKFYMAVKEGDVLSKVAELEEKYGVNSYPISREIVDQKVLTIVKKYNDQVTERQENFMRIKTTYRFVNMHKPDEFIDTISFGDGIDGGDKAPGKSMTYSDKYALLKAYKVETGDDPDNSDPGNIKTPTGNNNNSNIGTGEKQFIKDADYKRLMESGAIDEIKSALSKYKMKKELREALDGRMKTLQIKRAADGILKPKVSPTQLKTRLDSNDPVKIQALLDKADLTPQQTEEVKAYLKKLKEATTTVEDDLPV